ncbi:hypothetical protein KFE96_04830 [Kordiimonas sp. SCSIO 12603]|uniref:potassium channel family protein n=1 Tax=Kordiimonas sp. SCSIO 12603 TaxID=2829596 RepID=UPI002102B7C5|nr:potassium channel family protein [Kordiimonas sp. SCSIO 12603]UTW59632.1 hypothetical protein KFE96_04830 [Kordiimonas sp. SCSIO 12603]
MSALGVLFSKIYLKCVELDWSVLALVAVLHYMASYFGFMMLGEAGLLADGVFAYYYFTTVSTVGYGDYSPVSESGRLFFILFMLPGGLTIFTVVLGKAVSGFSQYFKKKANGMGDYSKLEGATVIVGYHPQRTRKMVAEIKAGSNGDDTPLVLISKKDVPSNPDWRFIKTESLSSFDDLKRAAVEYAARVIVYADTDDLTLAAVLAVRALNKDAHVVCFFSSAEKAQLLGSNCDAEIVVSSSVEMVARELTDPGSNAFLSDLMSAQSGVAAFRMDVPEGEAGISRTQLSKELIEKAGATLISVKPKEVAQPIYDPRSIKELHAGDTFFYIADKRLDPNDINWRGA